MSKLQAFLKPAVDKSEKEVFITDRFLDENGKPALFKIRALYQEENDRIVKMCRRTKKVKGQTQESLDTVELSRRMIVEATIEPDFRNAQLCEAYGVVDPLLVPGKMLLAGEFAKLSDEISTLSGFSSSDEIEDEAKN